MIDVFQLVGLDGIVGSFSRYSSVLILFSCYADDDDDKGGIYFNSLTGTRNLKLKTLLLLNITCTLNYPGRKCPFQKVLLVTPLSVYPTKAV